MHPRKRSTRSPNNRKGQRLQRIASTTKAKQVCSHSHSSNKIHIFHLKWRLLKARKICLRSPARRTANRQNRPTRPLQCSRAPAKTQILTTVAARAALKRQTDSATHKLIHRRIHPGIIISSEQNSRLSTRIKTII